MANPNLSHEQWPAAKVRDTFLDFFKQKGHTFGASNSKLLFAAAAFFC